MSVFHNRRRTSQRAATGLAVVAAVMIVPAFTGTANGQPDPTSEDGKGQRESAAPARPAAPECDLNEGGHANDEFAHCTEVVVSFASTPTLGGSTTVDVDVTSVADVDSATLTLLVNDGFDVTDANGFASAGTKQSGVGPMTAISRSVSLTADQTESFSIEVDGAEAGVGVVQARFRTAGGMLDGGDEASVQLGASAPISPRGRPTVAAPDDARQAAQAPGTARYHAAPVDGAKSASPQAPNASCATGRWVFNDEQGFQNGSENFQIQVWDQDSSSGDDHLATGVTGGNGNYNLCFESTDGEGGGQEVYVRFISENSAWRVRNTAASNSNYVYGTGVINLADPGTANFGPLQPANAAEHRALHAFDGLNRLFLWQASINPAGMDDPGQARQMVLNWTATSTDGTYYSLDNNDIHLAAADPDADHTTIHEGAHALMDAVYDDDYPPFPNCNPHSIFGPSSTGCAWTEGFAEWVPARVLNDPFYRWPDGSELNLETPSWHNFTGAYGDTSEGRIAGALIDLSDTANEAHWDRFSEGGSNAASEEIYATFLSDVSDTLNEFFNTDRPGEGDTGFLARAAVFQNTIDYTHRDPLFSQQQLTRPSLSVAPNPHNYSYSAGTAFWGGVAIRPGSGGDFDLRLYDDQGQTVLLESSAFGTGTIDYVLVDGNHLTGDFFPRAFLFSGSGEYQIEEFTGNNTLGVGSEAGSFSSTDVIQPFDASVSAGQTNYVRVVPSGGLDVELFAHDSDGTAAGAVQRRSESLTSSSGGGAGAPEALSYSSPDSDWTGLVVLNKGGSGTYTIYRDTAGPSAPSVVIDGGNSTTYDTSVDLTLSATAGATPVTEMQISTDGVFDSEAWVPYATSRTVTLPAGLGTKTVTVRYRNAAGAPSAPASDTINLVATPTCDGLTATVAGNGAVNGTAGNDVIVGGPGNDTINGFGGNDVICGLGGADNISDGPGADTVRGAGGNDTLTQPLALDSGDVLDGGLNVDTVRYHLRSGDVTITLNGVANDGEAGENDQVSNSIENVVTGSGNDKITASAAANTVTGNNGDDVINGGDEKDVLRGLAGLDVINGGGGNDTVDGGVGNDVLRGDAGNDTILGGDGNDSVDEGGAANGSDIISGNAGNDRITYASRAVAVAIKLTGDPTSGAAGENDRVTGFEEAVGGSGGDTILGHVGDEKLVGNGGGDTITGNGGDDTITGGTGADDLFGSAGDDWLNSKDNVNGNDTINGGADTDTAVADPGDTVLQVP